MKALKALIKPSEAPQKSLKIKKKKNCKKYVKSNVRVKSYLSTSISKSSRLDVLCRKGVLRNFAKFTGKHLRQSLFLNKVSRPATLLRK